MLNIKEKLVVSMFGYDINLVVKPTKTDLSYIEVEVKDLNLEMEKPSTASSEDNLEEVILSK